MQQKTPRFEELAEGRLCVSLYSQTNSSGGEIKVKAKEKVLVCLCQFHNSIDTIAEVENKSRMPCG